MNDIASLKLHGDKILIEPTLEEAEKKTATGIIIPSSSSKGEERIKTGKVIAIGNGKYEAGKLVPVRVSVGSSVYYSKYNYDELEIGGKKYIVLPENGVIASYG